MPSDTDLVVERPLNKDNLNDLLTALRRAAGLIPFVGAGLSIPFGFPQWGAFLRGQAQGAGVGAVIESRLAKGEYEEAAENLQEALGALAFEDAIRRTFGSTSIKGALPEAAVRALPALATGPVLTTNFDRVLETVFEEAGQPFEDIVWGAQASRIAQALHVNGLMLWKLHGDYKTKTDRVLTHSEYTEHYGHGDPAQFDWTLPLPRLFDNLLAARPVLFLGSGLEQDRTVRVLAAFAARHPGVGHYAVLEDPADDPLRQARARALSNVGVRPIWFPKDRYDLIGPFLAFLAEQGSQAGSRHGIASQQKRIEQGIDAQRHLLSDSAAQADARPQRVVGDPPDRPERFHGRASQLQDVGARVASAPLVMLTGPSGIGKTALAVQLLTDLEANRWPALVNGRPVDGIAYLSTRTDGITLERIYLACARMLGGAARVELERAWKKDQLSLDDKIQRLLDALRDGLFVILLDHIEDLLDPDGAISDADLRRFVDRWLAARGGSRVLATSRGRLVLPRDAARRYPPIELDEGLSPSEGIAMLRDLIRGTSRLKHLTDETLALVVDRLHGVPRALEVFVGILAVDEFETVDQLLKKFYNRADAVDDLFKDAINRLDEPSLRVVEALAVLGQPVPAGAIDMLLQPFVPGLDLPVILPRLSRRQMVRLADQAAGTWTLHPIDQNFAYARCPEMGRYSRQALHHRAAEWYATIRPTRDKWNTLEGLEPLRREFDHRVKAGLYDDAAAVLSEFDDELRGTGNAARSLEMHLQLQGRITVDRIRLLDMLGLAHAYRHIGPLDKAIATYKDTLPLARAQQNAIVEIEALGWIGETYRRLTQLDEGVVFVRDAVAAARGAGDRTRTARWLGELALTCCYRAELKEALDAADEALALAVEIGDINWEALAIDALALIHLARGEPEKAIKAAERTLTMYQGVWQHTVIYVLNVMGLANLDLQRIDQGIEYLERARAEARESEDIRVEGIAEFNLAHAHRLKGDDALALAHAECAVQQLTRTQGGELPAAQALANALRARAAGIPLAESRALVAVARACISNPDLRNPRGILADAVALATGAGHPDLAAEAQQLLASLKDRDTRAQSGT